jgi:hypothetical protein
MSEACRGVGSRGHPQAIVLIANYIPAPACCQFFAQYIEDVNAIPSKRPATFIEKLN